MQSSLFSSLLVSLTTRQALHPALEPKDDHDDDDGAARHEPEDEEAVWGLEEGEVLELQLGGREGKREGRVKNCLRTMRELVRKRGREGGREGKRIDWTCSKANRS